MAKGDKLVPAVKAATTNSKPRKRVGVRAVRTGFYEHKRRRAGDTFMCFEDEVSDATLDRGDGTGGWMERVGASVPEVTTTSQQALANELDAEKQRAAAAKMADGVI